MAELLTSLRLCLVTLLVCACGYPLLILGFARIACPESAAGSLVVAADGRVVGSRLLAQGFSRPEYIWPRPSAVDWNAAAAGGSNKSPGNPELAERAKATLARFAADAAHPLPADLAAASGSGLDPHVSEAAARFQLARVAAARGWPLERVSAVLERHLFAPGGPFGRGRLVNVLELNLALDAER